MLSTKTQKVIYILSGIIMILSAILFLKYKTIAPITFAIGTAGIIFFRIKNLKSTDNFRIKRLNNILALSSIFLIATVYFMFMQKDYWIFALVLSATLDLVVSFRMPPNEEETK